MTITADDLTAGIANAIRARDFPAMADMLRMLTTADPRQAGRVCETIRTALPDAPVQADREAAETALKMAASGWRGLFHLYGECYADPAVCPWHKDDPRNGQ